MSIRFFMIPTDNDRVYFRISSAVFSTMVESNGVDNTSISTSAVEIGLLGVVVRGDFGFDCVPEDSEFAAEEDHEVIECHDPSERPVVAHGRDASDPGFFHGPEDVEDPTSGIDGREVVGHDFLSCDGIRVEAGGNDGEDDVAVGDDAAWVVVFEYDDAPDVFIPKSFRERGDGSCRGGGYDGVADNRFNVNHTWVSPSMPRREPVPRTFPAFSVSTIYGGMGII